MNTRKHRKRKKLNIMLIILLPVLFMMVSFCTGRYASPAGDVFLSFAQFITGKNMGVDDTVYSIIIKVRFPRTIEGFLVGGALAASGACFQSLFRNPLVSSGMLGVSNGAGFGAALSIIIFGGTAFTAPFAFFFGIVAVLLAYFVGKVSGGNATITLVLGGVIVQSFFSALISLLKYKADPLGELPAITFWLMGSMASTKTSELILASFPMIAGMLVMILMRWRINVLSMGDREAKALGINTGINKAVVIAAATLATAGAVSVAGVVGWIGLIVPHMCRMAVGSNNRILIPASISFGGCFMILVDTLCCTVSGSEIPIGIVMALVGGPFFVYLLKKTKGKEW